MKVQTKEYITIVLLGISSYLPFYSVLGSHNYWTYFYDLQFTTIASCLFNCFETIAALISIPLMNKKSIYFVVNLAFIINIICLVILPLFIFIQNHTVRYYVSFIPICTLGLAAGLCFTALGTFSCQIDKRYAQALQLGTGTSELIVQILKIAFAYGGQYIVGSQAQQSLYCYYNDIMVKSIIEVSICKVTNQKSLKKQVDEQLIIGNDQYQQIETFVLKEETKLSKNTYWISTALFINQFVTYLLFPALTTSIPSFSNFSNGFPFMDEWFSLWMMSAYLFSDFLGRMIPKLKMVQNICSYKVVVIGAFLRLVFIPLLFLINLPRPIMGVRNSIIHYDWISYIIVILFSITGGILVPMLFMRAQDGILTPEKRHKVSNIATIFFSAGCTISGFTSIPIAILIKDK